MSDEASRSSAHKAVVGVSCKVYPESTHAIFFREKLGTATLPNGEECECGISEIGGCLPYVLMPGGATVLFEWEELVRAALAALSDSEVAE